jgi:hypothetical protein
MRPRFLGVVDRGIPPGVERRRRHTEYENLLLEIYLRETSCDLLAVPLFHDDDHIGLSKSRFCYRRIAMQACESSLEPPGEELCGCLASVLALIADEEDVHTGTESCPYLSVVRHRAPQPKSEAEVAPKRQSRGDENGKVCFVQETHAGKRAYRQALQPVRPHTG